MTHGGQPGTTLLDLPQDILDLIFPSLPPKSFLALCSVNKDTYERYHHDPLYWRIRTSETFRLPVSPLLYGERDQRADGSPPVPALARNWSWLYKTLRTQTRPFSWGKGVEGGLGPSPGLRTVRNRFRPRGGTYQRTTSSWPTEIHVREDVGIIVDIQCGGWSTTVLTSDGKLFTVGILDAANAQRTGEPVVQLTQLQKFGQFQVTGVRQFSAGRCHVLGLDDDGYVWSWDNAQQAGSLLSFQNSLGFARQIKRVVAGWAESSAYIPGKGIIFWPAISTRRDQDVQGYDRAISENLVPATGYRRSDGFTMQRSKTQEDLSEVEGQLREEDVGEVLAHIVLEGYIVFITHHNKLFACAIGGNPPDRPSTIAQLPPAQTLHNRVFEVPGYASESRIFKDIQGSFRNFAVFTASGEVLAGHTDYLSGVLAERHEAVRRGLDRLSGTSMQYSQHLLNSRPINVPVLQHAGVIALAFGDYHSHALHADGTITAYGVEPGCCGALGLGSTAAGARFRGVKTSRTPMNRDGKLLPIANHRGRQVWFEHEKRDWLQWLENWIRTPTALPHYPEVFNILNDVEEKQAAFSEWIEQEGRHWPDGPYQATVNQNPNSKMPAESPTRFTGRPTGLDTTADLASPLHDELPAYFAISVAAAGWHTGALVLVDDEKAEKTRQKWIADADDMVVAHKDTVVPARMPGSFPTPISSGEIREEYVWEKSPFPRIKLPDGYEFPGEGELRPWRDGMLTVEQLGLVQEAGTPN
jgi:SCF-associated factor 1